ncbi:fatty acid desaturase family protein [Leptolyngbya sp. AN03gr2]|uniref:fatty acid desaturase family protein n=1 Tax=unclassified Leptolyngbya TaxID=2650499 RepID=UPI003D31635C
MSISDYLQRDRPFYNAIALFYTLAAYLGGIALIVQANVWLNVIGVLALTHGLVLSAYLAHEFMHGTIFASMKWNAGFGTLILWLNGACYSRFQDLAKMHIAHHVDRVDFCRFNLAEFLNSLPVIVRNSLLVMEWLYFPALAFFTRFRSITAPFWVEERKSERSRVMAIALIRISLFALLGVVSLKGLLLYFVSYISMIQVLRFVDCFQHTYEMFEIGTPLPKRDRAHEQANTFSNVVSLQHHWLNLLLLNFGYHNAHHELMKCPWYRLPDLDRALFKGTESHYVTLPQLIWNYHRFRVSRIFSGQGSAIDKNGNLNLEQFYGGIEVSFLVLPA